MLKILKNIKIVDLTSVVLGPYATQILADLGADVIKIEPPEGDIFRYVGPSRSNGMGAGFLNINKNKRSICLNLKRKDEYDSLINHIKNADVFIHNMRPKAAERLGISHEHISAINSEIVYCAATGFGADGVYADKPAYDDIIQAESGIAWLAGAQNGRPQYVPTVLADKIAALFAAQSILAGIVHKLRTGEGSNIHVPMFECLASFLLSEHIAEKAFDPENGKAGYTRMLSKNRRPFETSDSFITVMPYSGKHWKSLFELLGTQDSILSSLAMDDHERSKNIDRLYSHISEKFISRTTDDWIELLEQHDVPCGRTNTLDDLFTNPHLLSVQFFETYLHPSEGAVTTTRHPVSFIGSLQSENSPPPKLGAHNSDRKSSNEN